MKGAREEWGGKEEMKCPKCDKELGKDDIEDMQFRGTFERHYAYMCKNCGYVIGFSSNAGPR